MKTHLAPTESLTVVIDDKEPRFKIHKLLMADFKSFAIVDMKEKNIVCHLVYENGEEYCDEMANKMLEGLNNQPHD